MDTFLSIFFGMIIGVWVAGWASVAYIDNVYREPMDALGIERFQKCEINTPNCHSNWYEIVWRKDCK